MAESKNNSRNEKRLPWAGSLDFTRVANFALFGAAGFGVGGLILGLASEAAGRVNWKTADFLESLPLLLFPLFMLIAGAIGGIALGLALQRRISCTLAVLMALGFFPGITIIIIASTRFSEQFNYIPNTVYIGLVLGILLGLSTKNWRKILLLSIAGALGGVAGGAVAALSNSHAWYIIAIQGAIGGAFLGGALGILETDEGKDTS